MSFSKYCPSCQDKKNVERMWLNRPTRAQLALCSDAIRNVLCERCHKEVCIWIKSQADSYMAGTELRTISEYYGLDERTYENGEIYSSIISAVAKDGSFSIGKGDLLKAGSTDWLKKILKSVRLEDITQLVKGPAQPEFEEGWQRKKELMALEQHYNFNTPKTWV